MTAKLTEADVLRLLRNRLVRSGNGGSGEHAFLPHVRNDASFSATRTFDAVVLDLWESRGYALHIYEVKVSRSDWLRELSKPEKADDACKIADHFWIVAPVGCVKDGELPPTWGLLEVGGDGEAKPWKIRSKTPAPRLTPPVIAKQAPPLQRGLVIAMLRSCPGAIPGGRMPSAADVEIMAAHDAGYKQAKAELEAQRGERQRAENREVEEWTKVQKALVAAGVEHWDAGPHALVKHAPAIARMLASEQAGRNLGYLRDQLREMLTELDALVEAPS